MKKLFREFTRRGMSAMGIGPLVLAVLYMILHLQGDIEVLTASQVCRGILSISALAFIAGGMNVLYQLERLPLMVAILIHGCVLYASYLATYLINGWLERGKVPILIFSGIFAAGYLIIWAVIYSVTRHSTGKINKVLKKHHTAE